MIERTTDGKINNCAIENGAPESECQICGGTCLDKVPSKLDDIVSIKITTRCSCGWESPYNVRITGVQLELQVVYNCPCCGRLQTSWSRAS